MKRQFPINLLRLSVIFICIWCCVASLIYRLKHPDQTETELFLHLWDAMTLQF